MKNYGCYQRLPHDYTIDFENPSVKAEVCKLCGDRVQFKKDLLGRIDNRAYLEAHIRNFAQPGGVNAQLYYILYHPELYEQNRWKWSELVCLDDECNRKWSCPHGRVEEDVRQDYTKKGTNGDTETETTS